MGQFVIILSFLVKHGFPFTPKEQLWQMQWHKEFSRFLKDLLFHPCHSVEL